MNSIRPHTTIGLRKATKSRLDKDRAPGQCYDGFLCQMMDIWEEVGNNHGYMRLKTAKGGATQYKELPDF